MEETSFEIVIDVMAREIGMLRYHVNNMEEENAKLRNRVKALEEENAKLHDICGEGREKHE